MHEINQNCNVYSYHEIGQLYDWNLWIEFSNVWELLTIRFIAIVIKRMLSNSIELNNVHDIMASIWKRRKLLF